MELEGFAAQKVKQKKVLLKGKHVDKHIILHQSLG